MRVKHDQERLVDDWVPAHVEYGDALAVEHDLHGARQRPGPLLVGHLGAVRIEPRDVRQRRVAAARRPDRAALKPTAAAKRRVQAAQPRQPRDEVDQRAVGMVPVEPRQLVVLAVARCCCRAASGRTRRRRAASARPATGTSSRASFASGARGGRGSPGRACRPRRRSSSRSCVSPSRLSSPFASLCFSCTRRDRAA